MDKNLDDKEKFEQEKKVVSRTRGIVIFGIIASALIGLFLYFNLTENNNSSNPISIASPTRQPTSSPTPNDTLTPFIPKGASGSPSSLSIDNSIPSGIAVDLATQLSGRDWANNPDSLIQRINNSIDSSYIFTVRTKIKSWNWAGCVKNKCIIGATIGKTTIVDKDSNNVDVTQVVLRYQNYTKNLPSDTWHIHMAFQSDGQWRATAISGPGF